MFLKNQSQLRQVNWATNYMWDIKLEDDGSSTELPSYFKDWIPATDINITFFDTKSYSIETPYRSFSIPQGYGGATMTLTIPDDDNRSLFKWFEEKYRQIYSSPAGVLPVQKSLIQFQVVWLNRQKEAVMHRIYKCIPTGRLVFDGDSSSGLSTLKVDLDIVNEQIIKVG